MTKPSAADQAASTPKTLIEKKGVSTKQNWKAATAIGGWSDDTYQCIFAGSKDFEYVAAIQFNKDGEMWCIPR